MAADYIWTFATYHFLWNPAIINSADFPILSLHGPSPKDPARINYHIILNAKLSELFNVNSQTPVLSVFLVIG